MSSVDDKSRFIAFFDECGDHSMGKIDKDFPLFVPALVVMERAAYRDQALAEFNRFKLRYFNHQSAMRAFTGKNIRHSSFVIRISPSP